MKSKQTLKVGQKYKVIRDNYNPNNKTPRIVIVTKLGIEGCFFDENDNFYVLNDKTFKLQLLTKKEVKKWKYSRKEINTFLENLLTHYINLKDKNWVDYSEGLFDIRKDLLAKQSTPKKKSKEIKEIEPISEGDMRCLDSERLIDKLWEKQCEVIDTINLLIKNK